MLDFDRLNSLRVVIVVVLATVFFFYFHKRPEEVTWIYIYNLQYDLPLFRIIDFNETTLDANELALQTHQNNNCA